VDELYVYYKVAAADAAAALALLAAWPSVRLLRRSDEAGALQTWMEIHTGPEAIRSEQALALALQPYLAGPRHVERFVALRAP